MKRSKTLEKYTASYFLMFFFYCMTASVFMFMFIDFVGKISRFMTAGLGYVFSYYLNFIPFIITLMIPTSVMLASLFTFSTMSKKNEISAMKSAGLSTSAIIMPILRTAILLSILVFLLNEFIVPNAELARRKMDVEVLRRSSVMMKSKHDNIWYLGEGNVIYSITRINPADSTITGLRMFHFRDRHIITDIVDIQKARFVGTNKLRAENLFKISIDSIGEKVVKKDVDTLKIKETFNDFLIEQRPPETMNFIELKQYIEKMERAGLAMQGKMADYHFKFALPFLSIIIVFLSTPLVIKHSKTSNAKNIGTGLGIIFFYYITMKTGLSLGHAEVLHPILAAWLGNIIYAIWAFVIFLRAKF